MPPTSRATIAIDATYTADPQPSGVSVYSRRLIESLLQLPSKHRFLVCYRLSRWKQRKNFINAHSLDGKSQTRFFQPPFTFWLPRQARLFHSLAQRPAPFRFQREVVTIHDVFPLTSREYSTPEFQRKFSALLLEAARRSARIITPSRYTAEQLTAHAGVAPEKLRVIPEGVDLPEKPLPLEARLKQRELRVGKGNEMILVVGVLQTRKNTLGALRALARLPKNYQMILAGGNGHGSDVIYAGLRSDTIAGRVTQIGHASRDELSTLYQSASVLLFPSFEEGFGLPVLEAMAWGLPVVTSGTSSLPEVGGDSAAYVDPNNPDDMAARVRQVVENEPLRKNMIEAGLRRAREFPWKKAAQMTLEVYDELLEEG